MRLFTSPAMTKAEVQLWCQLVRENKGKVTLFEIQLKSAAKQLTKKEKAASQEVTCLLLIYQDNFILPSLSWCGKLHLCRHGQGVDFPLLSSFLPDYDGAHEAPSSLITTQRGGIELTGHAEVAGTIQVGVFCNEQDVNQWLLDNGDCEVVNIQISGAPRNYVIMVTYRKEVE